MQASYLSVGYWIGILFVLVPVALVVHFRLRTLKAS